MAAPTQHFRQSTTGFRVMAVVLTVAVLIPAVLLFRSLWNDLDDREWGAAHARHGVEYATVLGELATTLVAAQSAAVAGEPVSADALTAAVDATTMVDGHLGEHLRVDERWRELRNRIDSLASAGPESPAEAYTAWSETTDLLLDLLNKVRETSGLIRDDDPDVYYLQDGAVEELPEAIVAAGRLVDLVVLDSGSQTEISVARVALVSPSTDLANNLQAALESTESRTLSGNVLSRHDAFLREKDALLAAVPSAGTVDQEEVTELRQTGQQLNTAAAELFDTLMTEMDALLAARQSDLSGAQRTAALTLAGAVLLIAGAVVSSGFGLWWRRDVAGQESTGAQ